MARDRQSMVLGERRGGASKGDSAVVALLVHFLERGTTMPLCVSETHKKLASPPLFTLDFHLKTSVKINRLLIPALGLPLRLSHKMALAALNTIQFYQPPTEASLPRKRVPKTSNANYPTVVGRGKSPKAPGPSDGWSALWGHGLIEFIDIADSPSREHLNLFRERAPDLKDTEADAEGKVFSSSLINSLLLSLV